MFAFVCVFVCLTFRIIMLAGSRLIELLVCPHTASSVCFMIPQVNYIDTVMCLGWIDTDNHVTTGILLCILYV